MYGQLGITDAVLNGTADESTMLNYYNRTVEPIVLAICDECKRKFLTKTARSQGQTIMANRDPFRLLPLNNLAEIADKFTRNEILTSNEIRQLIGFRPADDKKADQLVNSNMPQPAEDQTRSEGADNTQQAGDISATQDELFNSTIDSLSKEVDAIIQNGDTVSHSDKSVNQSTQLFNESLELLEKSIDDIINKLGPRGDEDE